jgi:hypothetical protein
VIGGAAAVLALRYLPKARRRLQPLVKATDLEQDGARKHC